MEPEERDGCQEGSMCSPSSQGEQTAQTQASLQLSESEPFLRAAPDLQPAPSPFSVAALWKRYAHVSWALADQTMVSGVNFLTGILLARHLGLRGFGVFTLAWMAVLFVNSLQMALVVSPMMSIGPKQGPDEAPAYYGAVLAQQAIFAVLSFGLLLLAASAGGALNPRWQIQALALPLSAAAFAFQMQDFLRRYFFTRGRGASAFANDAVSYLGQLALLVYLFGACGLDTAGALWVIAGTSAAAVCLGALECRRLAWHAGRFYAVMARHWNFARWLTASALLQWTTGNLFIVVAGGLLGATSVGALKAAQNVLGVTHILFQGLDNIVPARAAQIYAQSGVAELLAYLRRVTWAGVVPTTSIALLAAAVPAFWLRLFYGEAYLAYGYVLRWYALIYVVIFFGLPLRAGLRALEHTRPIFASYACATVFSLAACYPMVEWLGLYGVLGGILLTQLAMIAIMHWAQQRLVRRPA
jgi:O-antigen/teichoic acid export membrane protein